MAITVSVPTDSLEMNVKQVRIFTMYYNAITYDLLSRLHSIRCDFTSFLDINECDSLPCSNGGVCHDEVDGYNCVCPDGFTGDECQTG